jgi:sugar phosphate isomerase/epimerase
VGELVQFRLDFGDPRRGWDFVSPGRGDVEWDPIIRALNRIGYAGPLSIEWEDSGMDREYGAQESGLNSSTLVSAAHRSWVCW